MLVNNVQESSTTTGVGNFTLDGSSEFGRTFSSEIQIGIKFDYSIRLDESTEFESGIGYLLDSTTLVREFVQDSSSAGALVNFSAGTKQVFIAKTAQNSSYPPTTVGVGAMSNILYPSWFVGYSTSYTERSNQMYLLPWRGEFKCNVSNWAVYIKTASPGAVIRMGIYGTNPATGEPTGAPIYESDNIPCDSTGLIEFPMLSNVINPDSSIKLPDNFFVGIAFSDTVISITSVSYTVGAKTWVGSNSNGAMFSVYQSYTMGVPTLGVPTLPVISSLNSRGENYPIGGFN